MYSHWPGQFEICVSVQLKLHELFIDRAEKTSVLSEIADCLMLTDLPSQQKQALSFLLEKQNTIRNICRSQPSVKDDFDDHMISFSGVGAMTWSPLACGIISGKYDGRVPPYSRASLKVDKSCSLFSVFIPALIICAGVTVVCFPPGC